MKAADTAPQSVTVSEAPRSSASAVSPPTLPVASPTASAAPSHDLSLARTAVELMVRAGVLLVLVVWCFWIVRPFVVAVLWGAILAVAIHPGYRRMSDGLGDRRALAAMLLTGLALLLLIGPLSMLITALVGNIADLADRLTTGDVTVPPPPATLADWPVIGERLEQLWGLASVNLLSALNEVQPQIRALARWLLSFAAGAGLGLLNFVAAVVIAGLLLAHSTKGGYFAATLATRLVGQRGPELAALAEHTVRNVARGVLGTALIQSALAGVGFVAAGVPWAALLTLGCFLLCTVQIGPAVVLLGAVIYTFSTAGTVTAALFLVWCVLVALVDNVLKPLLIGGGSEVPMAVILAGVLGGLLAHGLIGLFVGPIVLALGYELFRVWLAGRSQTIAPSET